ncbi:MAG: transposase [Opitutaceae bacterium]
MHLPRLTRTWIPTPVTFITTCTASRRAFLASNQIVATLRDEWIQLHSRHGWNVGRYVVMPDHVHFFMTPATPDCRPLPTAIGKWKEWTSRKIAERSTIKPPIWQASYFDRVLRSEADFSETWSYIRENPVRGGLVGKAEDWPYAGAMDFELARVRST